MNMEMEVGKTPDENLFVLVAMLARKLGKSPLNNRLFIHRIDKSWNIVVNGCRIAKGFKEYSVPPGHCLVEFDGWPAALFSPHGGFFKGVEGSHQATEKAFIRALKDGISRATPSTEEAYARN